MEEKSKNFGDKVSDSFKQGTKPKFLGGQTEGGEAPAGLKANDKKSAAAAELNSSENHAAGMGLDQAEDNVSGTRESEEQAGGLYSGDGKKQAKQGEDSPKPTGFMGIVGKGGPIYAILFTIVMAGGLMGGAQLFQPFSLVAQFTETFNSMHTSAKLRTERFFRAQMQTGRVKSPYNLFGTNFKLSKKQISKLAAQGIEYDDDYNGTGERVLKFADSDGSIKIIAVDDNVASKIGDNAIGFKKFYADNVDFFNKYNAGSMTWRGAIANWFGSLTEKFIKNNNLTRNIFGEYKEKVAENGGDTKAATQEILSKRTGDVGGGGFETDEKIKKQDGEENGEPRYVSSNAEDINPNDTAGYIEAGVENENAESASFNDKTTRKNINVGETLDKISGKVQQGANIACTVGNVIGAVTLLVTAAEALQIINITMAYFETVDKVKAGDGSDAPIHDLTNALNEKKANTNPLLTYSDEYKGYFDNNGNITEEGTNAIDSSEIITREGSKALDNTQTYTSEKTAMQSSGISALYGGGPVNKNDPSVQSFNFTGSIKRIMGGIGVSMAGFGTCTLARITANAVSAVLDGLKIAKCIAGLAGAAVTFGGSAIFACGDLAIDIAKSIAKSVVIGITVAAVIATITPIVSNMLTRDLVSELGGEDLGNALTSGGNMYLGNAHRYNGGSLATINKYKEFAIAQQQVIAENAKYERSNLSPFDITSKYTFLGTILTNMMSFLTSNSVMSTVMSGGAIVNSSIIALLPTASAYDIEKDLPGDISEYESQCPYLASIGAIGDAYCNPYSITDVSTMGIDPMDVINKLDSLGSFQNEPTSDGNVKIDGSSNLAKYILYCDSRQSAFGIADNNIVNNLMDWGDVRTENSTFNAAANSAIGAVPILGDVIDVGQNTQALRNAGYVSGESCVAGNTVSALESPDWDTGKYYQRFIEDQALSESMGLIEESAVTAFLDEYYEKNPLDNSYEGILARKTGLEKDTVVAILDLVDYGNYIADYDPSTRYAFGAPAVEAKENLNLENEYRLASAPILLGEIVYADVRNRNFVV